MNQMNPKSRDQLYSRSMKWTSQFFILGLFFIHMPVSFGSDLSVLGGFTFSSVQVSGGDSSRRVGLSGGGTFSYNIDPYLGWEAGLIYMTHPYSVTVSNLSQDWSREFLEIPAWLWFSPIPFVSVGAGGYYGIATGLNSDLDSSKKNDYGALVMAGIRFPILPLLSWRLAAFYRLGFANLDNGSGVSQYTRSIDLYAGLIFDFF